MRLAPVMDDLVDIVGLGPLLEKVGPDMQERNFEVIYSRLASEPIYANKVKKVERNVRRIPTCAVATPIV